MGNFDEPQWGISVSAVSDGSAAGQGKIEIAFDALNRLGHPLPYGVKTALGAAVKSAVTGNSQLEQKATSLLESLGFSTKRSGFFGLRKSIDYSTLD